MIIFGVRICRVITRCSALLLPKQDNAPQQYRYGQSRTAGNKCGWMIFTGNLIITHCQKHIIPA
jgi:hypothetical protein